MTFNETFLDKLWKAHFDWSTGILYSEVRTTTSATFYLSDVPGEYYNFAVPTAVTIEEFDLKGIAETFNTLNKKVNIELFSKHQAAGFAEYLVRKGYKSHGGDCWLVLDSEAYKNPEVSADITEINPGTFGDYYSVLSPVFSDFSGNEKYLELCLKSIKGELSGKYKDLVSKLFVIYEGGKPVSGAGLFYSKEANIAYLHDGGTLPGYRGKGYQTALIRHRSNLALKEGISCIYTCVEPGGQSWSNCIKVGFGQTPWALLLGKE